ncbi:MAG: hypothetical protein XU08_C0005G0040 [candidate division WWE3 bacterium CSP1-7]|uniref:Lipoprotein n=1 Tax=candidate division WWE3 bacterium CSP1-7 TaxID=1576480 RepID=A0A0T5ZWX8_UNCKA|nr:MAG: hypothetical protein XU08_C0005G0040 [candidate division WWE3 bacterium CSP1-7]
MNRKLIFTLFALVLTGLLTACNGTVPVTVESTAVIPTEVLPTAVPFPTPTLEPTTIPTEVPTPTATPDPVMAIVWDIAQQMLAECTGAYTIYDFKPEYSIEAQQAYMDQLWTRVSEHPEIWREVGGGSSQVVSLLSETWVLANDGVNPNPFALAEDRSESPSDSEMMFCEGYVLTYDGTIAENKDGDGILVGEAYLFYEVGGTQPYVLDGELKEVIFTFPPVP